LYKLSDNIERKFIEVVDVSDWEIETESGWEPITSTNKTIEYEIYRVILSNGLELLCADTHILMQEDYSEIFAVDSIGSLIRTKQGIANVVSVEKTGIFDNMYDLSVDSVEHTYYTNDILSHNSTTTVGFILWYSIFSEMKTVAILANKERTSREILSRYKLAYEHLPLWMQQGVLEWNKGTIELENGCKVIAASTSSSAIRGQSINLLYLDEFAFVPNNIADEFFASVYPTISSGTTSKIIISSTPNGMNHFYKICSEAKENRNGFKLLEITWRNVPGRDEKWEADQRSTLGEDKFLQEMEGEFLGSSGTLISTTGLKSLSFIPPLFSPIDGLDIYHEVEQDKNYVIIADTARGNGGDYSALVVIDIDEVPYKITAKYRNNTISPMMFPDIIVNVARLYNSAYLLIENNDAGGQVADTVLYELEYDNMFYTENIRGSTQLTQSGNRRRINGIRTDKRNKRLGCIALKSLVEGRKLLIQDFEIITELSTFIHKKDTYMADDGHNDDLVMCLVLFSWMSTQPFFKDLSNTDIRQKLFDEKIRQMEESMPPMPFTNESIAEAESRYIEDGVVWEIGVSM